MLKKRRIQMTIIAAVFCLTFSAGKASEASGQTGEMSDLFYQYIGEVLIPEYGLSGSDQTTQMSAYEEYSGQWLQSGILSAAVTDLDGDGKEECLVFLLEDEDEEELDLYALVYEEEDGEVQLSDSRHLDSVYQSDWWKCGWNISLIENEDSSSYILFEDCTWGNTWYALEISMSASYLVEEEYEIFGYDGTSFEDIYSYVQGGAASGGFEYEEYVYESGSLVSERALYSSIPSDAYADSGSGSVFGSYTEAMNYVAGLYGLTVNTDLISDSDTDRLWPQMSESIFLDSENLTRIFRYAILTEDTESPYTYEQILVDYTDQEWSSCYQGAGGSDTADDSDYYFIFVEGELDSDQTYVFADIYAYDAEGEYLWEYETGAYEPTELSRVYEIGQRNGCYYYVEGGTVVALEAETGEILWENSEFGGSGQSAFSDAGICLTGFYGPDFFAVSYDGTTLCEIDSFGTEYYWASYIEIVDNTALVTLNEGEHEAQVNLDTWEYTINY